MLDLDKLNRMQMQVAIFMQCANQKINFMKEPMLQDEELRARLIEEEAKETCDAIRAGNLIDAIVGICDLIYVLMGAANAFGVDAEKYFQIVHNCNMKKFTGPKDIPGKQLKPPDFIGPEVEIKEEVKKEWGLLR